MKRCIFINRPYYEAAAHYCITCDNLLQKIFKKYLGTSEGSNVLFISQTT
jgi:hypothetical protein